VLSGFIPFAVNGGYQDPHLNSAALRSIRTVLLGSFNKLLVWTLQRS